MMFNAHEVIDLMKEYEVKQIDNDIYGATDPANLLRFIEGCMARMMGKRVELDFSYLPDGNWEILRKRNGRWDKLNVGKFTDIIFNIPITVRGEEDGQPEWISVAIWSHDSQENPLMHLDTAFNRFY